MSERCAMATCTVHEYAMLMVFDIGAQQSRPWSSTSNAINNAESWFSKSVSENSQVVSE
jgi:hypothetical protein